jgi:F-box-like
MAVNFSIENSRVVESASEFLAIPDNAEPVWRFLTTSDCERCLYVCKFWNPEACLRYDMDSVLVQNTLVFLGVRDVLSVGAVCKLWRRIVIDNPWIWEALSIKEVFPLVEGEGRNRKSDFKMFYKKTIVNAFPDLVAFGGWTGFRMPHISLRGFDLILRHCAAVAPNYDPL